MIQKRNVREHTTVDNQGREYSTATKDRRRKIAQVVWSLE
jgi:hypothetical protein